MHLKKQPQSSDTPKPLPDQIGEEVGTAQQSLPNEKERRTCSDRRDSVVDRRSGLDRRDCPSELKLPNMERRRGAGIRRPEDRRAAEEGELTTEQFEFVMAIEEFKKANKKTFPTWTEVLEVIKLIGYRKPDTEQVTEDSAENE
jgi:hypothetical protein